MPFYVHLFASKRQTFSCVIIRRFYCNNFSSLKRDMDLKFDKFWFQYQNNSSLQAGIISEGSSNNYLIKNSLHFRLLEMKQERDAHLNVIDDLKSMLSKKCSNEDKEFARLAELELAELIEKKFHLEMSIVESCLPINELELENQQQSLTLSTTAGAGGQEAMLFAKELFTMYENYARYKSWIFDITEKGVADIGGYHFASATVSGPDAFKCLRFESGVHRVQRVPVTEKTGRMHTSTVSVTVCPSPKNFDLVIPAKDIRKDTFRASSPGGQNMQMTESAVRLTHLPTKLVAECQQERSQITNYEVAMKRLVGKLYEAHMQREAEKLERTRKLQMGLRGRSEKIRTYNFSDNRVSDHRIKQNFHPLNSILAGNEGFDQIVSALLQFNRIERISELLNNFTDDSNNDIAAVKQLDNCKPNANLK